MDYNKLKSLEGVLWNGPQAGPGRLRRLTDYALKMAAMVLMRSMHLDVADTRLQYSQVRACACASGCACLRAS